LTYSFSLLMNSMENSYLSKSLLLLSIIFIRPIINGKIKEIIVITLSVIFNQFIAIIHNARLLRITCPAYPTFQGASGDDSIARRIFFQSLFLAQAWRREMYRSPRTRAMRHLEHPRIVPRRTRGQGRARPQLLNFVAARSGYAVLSDVRLAAQE
jgi:hypothetical protein